MPGEGVRRRVARYVGPFALGYLTYRTVVTAINAATLPRLRPECDVAPTVDDAAPPVRHPRVSLLVPARDEAENVVTTVPALVDQGAAEVLVLDDHSSDATAQLAGDAGARVLPGEPLPDGWVGKTWACHQLAAAALRGEGSDGSDERAHPDDVLVLTDADVTWHPGALDALAATMERTGADLLSVFPRQVTPTLGERLITPLVDAAFVGHLPAALVRGPGGRFSLTAANGQVMALRRSAYEAAGGHAAVRGDVVEDLALARRVRASGGRVVVALGGEAIEVRMYRDYAGSVAGFAKSALGVHAGSRALLTGSAAWFVMTYVLPWLLPATGWIVLARLVGVADRALVNLVVGRRRPLDLAEALLGPVTPLLTLPVYARALRRAPEWKGRTYR